MSDGSKASGRILDDLRIEPSTVRLAINPRPPEPSEWPASFHAPGGRPDRAPDKVIGPPNDPYMLRWYLIPRNPVFNVYYHVIRHDDDDRALHDHPWPSFSVMQCGVLREVLKDGSRIVRTGDFVWREPLLAHRLELVTDTAETLFITGPVLRDWGFHCPKGWVYWRDFVDPEDTGAIGRGCGEMG